jgi:hypothetical protein
VTVVPTIQIYLGPEEGYQEAQIGQSIDDDGSLGRGLRRRLLDEPERFVATITIPKWRPVDLHWSAVGQTTGVGFWRRGKRLGAASILVNGTECDREVDALRGAFIAHGMVMPEFVWEELDRHEKPVAVNLYFDLYHYCDPVIATVAPALGNAYFKMFGTNEVRPGEEPWQQ